MKKIFSLIILLILIISYHEDGIKAQGYGGVCCQAADQWCVHPIGMAFDDSRWVGSASTCTGHEEQE